MSNSASSCATTVFRYATLFILGVLLALVIWVGSIFLFMEKPSIPTLHISATSASQTVISKELPIQNTKPIETIAPTAISYAKTTRTPRTTPTPYPTPDSTWQSNRAENSNGRSTGAIIGYSVNGLPLNVVTYGSGSTERMIVAGIHGGYEWNTINLANQLIAYLKLHPEIVPEGIKIHILRALNPDGEARSHGIEGRANTNGVDLNRNFPSHWQAEWSRDGCWDYGPITAGTHPNSEPEIVALMNFIKTRNIDALISYHSAALGIFPGGNPPDDNSLSLAAAVASVSTYPYPPINTGCQFSGQLIDWASDQGIAAVDIELTDHENSDFDQNVFVLIKFLNWQP
ncbi:MAG: hypothetical protein H8D34_30510 [Chloroflexi bacterium]|nr:hypothetical protein [Chloroflexota bacterium]